MKTLVNKSFETQGGQEKIDVFTLLRLAVEQSGRDQGFSIGDIEKRIRVINVLKTTEPECQVEDADYAVLVQCWDGMRWGVVDSNILAANRILKEAK